MATFKELKSLYGPGIAKQLKDSKKQQEENKSASDSVVYWSEHPDFRGMPGKED